MIPFESLNTNEPLTLFMELSVGSSLFTIAFADFPNVLLGNVIILKLPYF